MLIITGTGRSGTSLIALWLKECGLLNYDSEWVDQFDAGLDNPESSRINKAIWQGSDPYYYSAEAKTKGISLIDYPIIKDTNFFSKHVLQTWLPVRKDMKFLICLRKFGSVNKSWSRTKQLIRLRTPEQHESDFGKFISTCIFNNVEFEIICFPELIDNYKNVYTAVKNLVPDLELDFEQAKIAWEKVCEKNKVHF